VGGKDADVSKVIAVIPAYEEGPRVGTVVDDVRGHVDTVVVVDDGSTDDTATIAREHGASVVRHVVNRGAGAAVATGIHRALELGARVIVTVDADGQHRGADIPVVVRPVLEDEADVVIGSRFLGGIDDMPLMKRIGNHGLTWLTRALYGVPLTDSQSGFRALNRRAAELFELRVDRYGFCSEMVGEVARNRLRLVEVPIHSCYLDPGKGTGVADGFAIALDLLLRRFMS
jgi:glycosyltransferase involved in cell wall biosynthesis